MALFNIFFYVNSLKSTNLWIHTAVLHMKRNIMLSEHLGTVKIDHLYSIKVPIVYLYQLQSFGISDKLAISRFDTHM